MSWLIHLILFSWTYYLVYLAMVSTGEKVSNDHSQEFKEGLRQDVYLGAFVFSFLIYIGPGVIIWLNT